MKLILSICAVIGVASANRFLIQLTPDVIAEAQPYVHKCQAETNAPESVFRNMIAGIAEDDISLKFAYCYLTGRGYMNKDGQLIASSLFPYIEDDTAKAEASKVIESCNKVNENDFMARLRLISKCYKENMPIVFEIKV